MKYAIISDIHANLEAFKTVLAAIEPLAVDRIVCLGDLVGYYANPNECIELTRRLAIACVRGNHDSVAAGLREPTEFSAVGRHAIEWTARQLTEAHRQYLATLPLLQIVDNAFVTVHASLYPQPNEAARIGTPDDARLSLDTLCSQYGPRRICFFGHMHHQTAYVLHNDRVSRFTGAVLDLEENASYLINPGSIGQSRDADPRAAIAVYDSQRQVVHFHRITCDSEPTRAKAIAAGLIRRPQVARRMLSWLKHRVLPGPPAGLLSLPRAAARHGSGPRG